MHGKTLIIDSLNILAGARFSKEIIRKGEEYSFVEMCLYLPENELSIDGNIIISREVHTNGRNLCKINGRMVTVNELKDFMENVIDIHGQYDNQTLMNVSTHIKLLDDFAGETLKNLKIKYTNLYTEYKEIQEKIKIFIYFFYLVFCTIRQISFYSRNCILPIITFVIANLICLPI